ncbi:MULTISPECIES: sporulation membrane protein YtrI [Bacillus]|jgi:predicted small secreted protein|uniref:Sporulation membrane protein YtrI C-terminal domain-containing protein n=1 Tax=Bacillus smithii 7_3_47FAA TaxID=665952 RepID=G9QQF9_9BACI|nr:sporulation membrane protein YtrI [Bacillus smithii]AKP48101.1 hypothetical protein BSM4216_2867 [Bacillus smithii]EHL73022.1 hypothetical protein HMPREF1015_00526 [Bacillus smithii 7_3_47FAA]MED1418544.1 sporulation protein [Bacillus smithii]MED1455887.1 sporulation protein [Bacillus smithii]
MRIPPLYHKKNWQIFIAGTAIGACVGWLVFLYMFGSLQEKQTNTIERQKEEISDLNDHLSIWQEEFKKLNKKNQEMLTVQNIDVEIINFEKYGIKDSHSQFEAEELIKKDLDALLAKNLETVFANKQIIKELIENKMLKIQNKRFHLKVKEVYFYTTVEIYLELELAK